MGPDPHTQLTSALAAADDGETLELCDQLPFVGNYTVQADVELTG